MMNEQLMNQWLALTNQQKEIENQLERALKIQSDLTLNEYYVLYFLSKSPNRSMRFWDLLQHIDLSQSAMSRMIARMENKDCGVIDRHSCHDDKRGIYIDLTIRGQEKVLVGTKILEEVLLNMFK